MRSLSDVIQKMIKEIPLGNEFLISELEEIQHRWLYAAPETWHEYWYNTAMILDDYVGRKLDEEWKKKVFQIFMGINE